MKLEWSRDGPKPPPFYIRSLGCSYFSHYADIIAPVLIHPQFIYCRWLQKKCSVVVLCNLPFDTWRKSSLKDFLVIGLHEMGLCSRLFCQVLAFRLYFTTVTRQFTFSDGREYLYSGHSMLELCPSLLLLHRVTHIGSLFVQ